MLVCKEELRRILLTSKRLQQAFEVLAQDVEIFEAEDLRCGKNPDHPDRTSAAMKLEAASQSVKIRQDTFEGLYEDLCMSLDEV